MWSLNRQLQCKSVKIYRAQTPQNLALTKISAKRAHPWRSLKFCVNSEKRAHPRGVLILLKLYWAPDIVELCSVDFHTLTTVQLPIQTLHSVAPELQVFVSSLKTSTPSIRFTVYINGSK